MKRSTFRITTALIAIAALASPLVACSSGGDGGAADGQVEIDFFHRWPNEPKKTYFDELVKKFEEENPDIKVNVESVLNDSYKDKAKIVAGSANAPDVMFSWSGAFIEELVEGDSLMDLGPWLDENPELRDSFYESQLPPFNIGGAQYGLPIGMHSKVFFYNADLFEELGVEVPKTWDDFLDVLARIQDKTGKNAIEFSAADTWTIAHYLGTLNQRIVDPEVFLADQDPAVGEFTDPGYMAALEHYQQLVEFMNEDFLAIDHEMERNAWIAGEGAPIMYAQSAEVFYFEDAVFDYSVFNFPAVEDGKGDPQQLTGAPEGFVISKNTKHPDESKRFVQFMLNENNGVAYTEETGELSAVKGAVEQSGALPIAKELAEQILDASEMTAWLDNAYDPQIVATYLTETQLMLGGQQTPKGVMEKVQETATRVRDAS